MTNPSKLEQVARAIRKRDFDVSEWDREPGDEKLYWAELARAAIAAMELPTEEMVEVGKAFDGMHNSRAAIIYSAMIRAALKEEK
jgi:hypothetical protein